MPNFADTMEQPVTFESEGKKIECKQLTTRDYLPWLEELTARKHTRDESLIPDIANPVQKFQIKRNIHAEELTPDMLTGVVLTAVGTLRVLDMALTKAGVSDETERNKLIDANPANRNQYLAARVSGLYTADEIQNMFFPSDLTRETANAEKTNAPDPDRGTTFGDNRPNAVVPPQETAAA